MQQIGKPHIAEKFSAYPVCDTVYHFRAVICWIDVDAKRTLPKRCNPRLSRSRWLLPLRLHREQQCLAAEHVALDIIGGIQTHPDKNLAAIGEKRHCPLVVAQHTVAMRVAAITDMIATVPRRMAVLESSNKAVRILEGPAALGSFNYVMIWHPRMQTDAAHVWLRSTIRELGRRLS